MVLRIPYRKPKASRETAWIDYEQLQRDFFEIERAVNSIRGGGGGWDAIVDADATTDTDAPTPIFEGIGEALSWLDAAGFSRALVLVREGTYTETASWNSPDDVVLFSAAQGANGVQGVIWDHAGFGSSYGSLTLYGLRVDFGAKQTGFLLAGTGYFQALYCVFDCLQLTGGTNATLAQANYCHYDSCAVDRMCRLGNFVFVRDMSVLHRDSTTAGNAVMANNWLIGNFILGGGTGGPTRTWTLPTRSVVEFETDTNTQLVSGAGGVSHIILSVASPTQCHVKGIPATSIVISGTPADVDLTGKFNDITLAGPGGGTRAHHVECRASGHVDITGPATLDLGMANNSTLTLRGAITGTIINRGATHSSGAWLNGVAMGASSLLVLGGGGAASGTARPYILDASSTHNFIMWPNLVSWANAGTDSGSNNRIETTPGPSGGPAPANADYLVGTAHAGLSAEIVVGTTPGGELGGTWASPTVDSIHSGSAHSDFSPVAHNHDAAYVNEGDHTKAAHDALALSHDSLADVSADDHHAQIHAIDGADHTGNLDAADITFTPAGTIAATDVQAAIEEVAAEAGGGGVTDHGALTGLADDDHSQYLKEKASGGTAAEVPEHTHADAANAGTVSHDDLTDVSIDDHHARDHAASHAENGADELDVASLGSGAASDGHVATADGAGGVAWEAVPGGHTEDHDHDGSPTQKLVQANTHESPDTDSGTTALHHTLGTGANQAAAGDHTHTGLASSSLIAFKTTLESVTSSTVFQDDNELTVTVEAGTYIIEMMLMYAGAQGGDLKFRFGGTATQTEVIGATTALHSGATGQNETRVIPNVTTLGTGLAGQEVGCITGTGVALHFIGKAVFSSSGTFILQWAQGNSHATATQIDDSFLKLDKVA